MVVERVVLAARPKGEAGPEHFRLEQAEMPAPGEDEVLVKVSHLSLDPYMRGRMSDAKSYADPVAVDAVMTGQGVGHVVESRAEGFAEGDLVTGMTGWQSHAVLSGKELRKLGRDTGRRRGDRACGIDGRAIGETRRNAHRGHCRRGREMPHRTRDLRF